MTHQERHEAPAAETKADATQKLDPRATEHPAGEDQAADNAATESPS